MTAHLPSNNLAIEAAHREIRATAEMRFMDVAQQCIDRPTRANGKVLWRAFLAVQHEYYAELERLARRSPGEWAPAPEEPSAGVIHVYEPQRRPTGLQGGLNGMPPTDPTVAEGDPA